MAEFLNTMRNIHDTPKWMKARAACWDKNGDGFISLEELEEFLTYTASHDPRVTGVDYETFVKEADTNADGKVSIDEFCTWIEKHLSE